MNGITDSWEWLLIALLCAGGLILAISGLRRLWRQSSKQGATGSTSRPLDATEDVEPVSSILLEPGGLRLRVRSGLDGRQRHRPHNEDNFYVPGRKSIFEGGSSETAAELIASSLGVSRPSVFIVADGMGGQQAGEEASRMAVEIIPREITRRLSRDDGDVKLVQAVIRESVAEANQEILGSSSAVTEYSNMGTTVVLALFREGRVYVAGIGGFARLSAFVTARSNSSRATTRLLTLSEKLVRLARKKSQTTASRTFSICIWAVRTLDPGRRTCTCWTSAAAIGSSWQATG